MAPAIERKRESLHPTHRENRRMEKNRQIHKKIPILYIVKIVFYVFVDQVRTISTKLPKSGDSRFHPQALEMTVGITFDNERHFGPRSNQRHIAHQYI